MSEMFKFWLFLMAGFATVIAMIAPLGFGLLLIIELFDAWSPLAVVLALPIMGASFVLMFAVMDVGCSWVERKFGLEGMD